MAQKLARGRKLAGAVFLLAAAAAADEAPNLARVSPPAARVTVRRALREGVGFLVAHQNRDGSFGHHVSGRSRELWCSVPGGHRAFKVASTALCWLGLWAAEVDVPGREAAAAKTLAYLARHARVKRASGAQFYNIWSHAYGLRALAVALRDGAPGAAPEALRAKARELIRVLRIYQSPEGGFGYLDFRAPGYKPSWSTSFTTATCLVALHEARAAGLTVPQELIDGGVRNILMCRTPEGSFLYGSYMRYSPARGINRPKGSSMRTPACNLALWLSGRKASEKELRTGLEQLVRHHRFAVAGVRRPIPHESWYQVSGYFYLYGHLYAAMVLEHLPAEDRARFWPHLVRSVLKCRQNDGSFWDYPTYGYHKAYGTGYALMTLARCPPAIAARLRPEKG